ncbi:DUF4290 domain-containing protein [bacterium]|nr:DUF4290 domain-containing protein [bacterium]
MEYNSARPVLKLSENGRIMQQMVERIVSIEDREQRSRAARQLVEIMASLNPQLRDAPDFRHKLWDQIHIMSGFALDVDAPYPAPAPESLSTAPEKVAYPPKSIKHRHYGSILRQMIRSAMAMEPDAPGRGQLIRNIANQMKKSYLVWNKDTVDDEVVWKELSDLSEGMLVRGEGMQLTPTQQMAGQLPARDSDLRKRVRPNNKKKQKKFKKYPGNG